MKSNQYVTAASKYANARPEFQRADRGTKEDSMDYTVSVNESSNNFWIQGNYGGTFSNFKFGTDSRKNFSSFRATNNIDKLIKKYDIDIRNSLPPNVKISSKEPKQQKQNSSSFVQNQILIFEEEKRMKEEKLRVADNINQIFRQYEKVYSKTFKKQSSKAQFISQRKRHPKTKDTMLLFEELCKGIAKENPSHAIAFVKLWKCNQRINESTFKHIMKSTKKSADQINKRFNEVIMECNNIFNLLDNRNQDILSLVEYVGDMKDTIEQVGATVQRHWTNQLWV